VGLSICQSKTAHQNPEIWLKDDTPQFERPTGTGRSAMVHGGLDAIPEFAHRHHMEFASWLKLRLIEMAYEFQGSAIRVQQFLPVRENQNAGSVLRRVIQRTQLGSRLISATHL
jgi:hypothetical protein